MNADPDRPLSAPFNPNVRKASVAVPALACDTHAHVFGPGQKYPFIPHGLYTPADALPQDYLGLLDALGCGRGVLVQPSIYEHNNQAMLDTMVLAPERLRGIAALPFDAPTAEIERLHGLGVRGVRCNIVDLKFNKGMLPLDGLKQLAANIAPFGWHVEFLMHVNEFPDLDRQLADFPTDVSFGHLGYVKTEHGNDTEGFKALLRMMKDGKAWVKLTAPYRLTMSEMPYPDTDETAAILVDTAPERLLWGSDWPHTYIKTAMPDDGELFELFVKWVPDAAMRERILVDNPAELYDF